MRIQLMRGLIVVLGLAVSQVWAGEAMDRLNAFLASENAIAGDFVQTVEGAAFSQPEESRGRFMMQRPGKFRWDYQTPYQQQIVADGSKLWIYDMDLEQVIVKPLDEALGDTPALLLSGGSSLNERFVATDLFEPREGLIWVQLLPRQTESGFQELRLAFGPEHLARMVLIDGFGQVTQLDFSNMQEDAILPAGTFNFVPPQGVDVIGGEDMVTVQPLAPIE